jgi:hypothetical protein
MCDSRVGEVTSSDPINASISGRGKVRFADKVDMLRYDTDAYETSDDPVYYLSLITTDHEEPSDDSEFQSWVAANQSGRVRGTTSDLSKPELTIRRSVRIAAKPPNPVDSNLTPTILKDKIHP